MHIKPSSRFSLYHFSKLLKFAIYLVYYVFLQLSYLVFLLYFSFKVCIHIVMQRRRSRQRRWKWCGEVSSEEVWVSIQSSTNCKSHLFCQFSTAEKSGANSKSFPPWKLWQQNFLLHGAKLFCHPAASSLRCCQFTHMDTHLYFYCLDFHRHRLCLPHHLPIATGIHSSTLIIFQKQHPVYITWTDVCVLPWAGTQPQLKPTRGSVAGWGSGAQTVVLSYDLQSTQFNHSQLRLATNTPVIRILEHSDPGRELELLSHLTRHPGALPWQHASLRVGHDSQVTTVLRAQTSQSIWWPIGVERVSVGGVASIVYVVENSEFVGFGLGVERLILEHKFTWKESNLKVSFLLLLASICGEKAGRGRWLWTYGAGL